MLGSSQSLTQSGLVTVFRPLLQDLPRLEGGLDGTFGATLAHVEGTPAPSRGLLCS